MKNNCNVKKLLNDACFWDPFSTDHQKVKAALMKKPFKGHNLTVDSIPESCTVLVNKLPQDPPVSEDLLTNYFESKRSDGGEVTNVELGSNGEYALVTFADTQGEFLLFFVFVCSFFHLCCPIEISPSGNLGHFPGESQLQQSCTT